MLSYKQYFTHDVWIC